MLTHVFYLKRLKVVIEIFNNGGVVFMGILSLVLLTILIITLSIFIYLLTDKKNNHEKIIIKINQIKSLGLFAMIFGLLGQLIGLFSAFRAIKLGEVQVTPSFFLEGFRISMISSIYGILIFAVSFLIWLVFKYALKKFV